MGLSLTITAILVYQSQPWKNQLYHNIGLIIMIVINLAIMTMFYVGNNYIVGLFETVALPSVEAIAIIFTICLVSLVVAFCYNHVVLKILHPEY